MILSRQWIASNKIAQRLRRRLNRLGLDVTGEPATYRIVRLLHLNGVNAVLDVGANVGQFGMALREARFIGDIVSVEPLSAAFRALDRRASLDPRWLAVNAAVSDGPGTAMINVAGNSASSSVLPMMDRHAEAAPISRYVASEKVAATTVDNLVAMHALSPRSSMLKIDVQGYEHAVLRGAVASLPEFAAVQMELSLVPLYEGQSLLPELWAIMDGYGFELSFIQPGFAEPATRRMLQVDGVFLRKPDQAAGNR